MVRRSRDILVRLALTYLSIIRTWLDKDVARYYGYPENVLDNVLGSRYRVVVPLRGWDNLFICRVLHLTPRVL